MGQVISREHWYVGYTRSCQEKKTAEALSRMGLECYIPIQKVRRKWSDRIKVVDHLVLPRTFFVRCTESRRRTLASEVYGIVCFMMDRGSAERKALIVPDGQMADFRFVVDGLNGEAPLEIVTEPIREGDMVKFVNGPLTGFVCECTEVRGKKSIIVRLGLLGSAVTEIDVNDIVVVKPEEIENK